MTVCIYLAIQRHIPEDGNSQGRMLEFQVLFKEMMPVSDSLYLRHNIELHIEPKTAHWPRQT
jgi:hypothetical protein